MDPIALAVLQSWTLDFRALTLFLVLVCIYTRGWKQLHTQMPHRYQLWRLICFITGLVAILLAIVSPVDAFGSLLLQVHMLQHLLLLMVAPPLIWLGQPVLALLRGLPAALAKEGLGPFLCWPAARRVGQAITHPLVCWFALAITVAGWHVPALYELGLHSHIWHELEHGCFLVAALLFWWPVIEVWPSVSRWPRWTMIPYLLLADLVNTALSAVLS